MGINILHVLATERYSGAEKVAEQICVNLKKNDKYNVYIICNGGVLLEKYQRSNINTIGLDVSNLKLENLRRFSNLICKYNINLVHAHGFKASFFVLICKYIFGLKYKIISHIHECSPWLMYNNYVKFVDMLTRSKYSLNILCGKNVYDFYVQYAPYIKKARNIIMSNAIDVPIHTGGIKSNTKNDDFIFGYVGRITELKGLVPLLIKLGEHKSILKNAKFVVVGDGDQADAAKQLVMKYGLADKVIFRGYREDVMSCISNFDILLMPSLREGLPMVALEAMSLGIPVLAFNVGSISELVKDGVTGFLVPPQEYDTFIGYMLKLKDMKDEIEHIGQKCKELINSNYSLENYIAVIDDMYTAVLNE